MGRFSRLRLLAHAATAGALLACMRAPLGLDWTQLVAVQASSAALFRAAGLLALVVALDPARSVLRDGPRPLWLAGLLAGYAGQGLLLEVGPGSRAGFALLLLLATVLARMLAGRRRVGTELDPPLAEPGRRERAGLVAIGAGVVVALEALARETRLFTLGTTVDEAVVGSVFLALLWLGALAFGPLLARLGSERTRLAVGAAACAPAALAGLAFLAALTPDGLYAYLRRLELPLGALRGLDERLGGPLGLTRIPAFDGATIGMHWTSAILAAAALVAPAFLLGGTLGSARSFARVRPLVLGAALGLLALPFVVARAGAPLAPAQLGQAAFAWSVVVVGASTAAAGLALVALAEVRARGLTLGLALVVAALPWLLPRPRPWSFSPWAARRVEPEFVWPLPEGLLTVEPARGGGRQVTLDRKLLTPTLEELEADERRLRAAFALLPLERRGPGLRALFVGQLTPERAAVLATLGLAAIDRTAAWHRAMPAVEERLFAAGPPPGEVLAPAEARERLDDGAYGWVVAAPAAGPIVTWKSEAREIWSPADGPRLTDLALEGETVGVAWIAGDARLAHGSELDPLVLDADRLEHLSLGLVRGPFQGEVGARGPLFRIEAARGPSARELLGTMPQQRSFALERATAAALVAPEAPELARGLALHFAAQRLSSPYETRAQQIELDEEALRAFAAAVPEVLDPLSVEVWEGLAWLCQAKRMPELALVYLEPVAERHAPWPALDRALAAAYREMLEPAEALRFLERLRGSTPDDLGAWIESAACAEEVGDPAQAQAFLDEALRRPVVRTPAEERALGLALARLGDRRGLPLLEKSLRTAPDDAEVRAALGLPPPEGDPHPH